MMIVPGASLVAEEHLLLFKGAGELLLVRRRLIAGLVDDIHFVLAWDRSLRVGERARKDGERRAKRGPHKITCSNSHARSVDWKLNNVSRMGLC